MNLQVGCLIEGPAADFPFPFLLKTSRLPLPTPHSCSATAALGGGGLAAPRRPQTQLLAPVSPVSQLAIRPCTVLVCVAATCVVHTVHVAAVPRGACKERRDVLICTVGLVFATFLVQLLLALAGGLAVLAASRWRVGGP